MSWERLDQELSNWVQSGRRARMWWRDDDATDQSAALGRLLAIAESTRAPVVIAAIPCLVCSSLARALSDSGAQVEVWQHGCWHHNHADAQEKSCEFPDGRDVDEQLARISAASSMLSEALPNVRDEALVPPWNRIGSALQGRLPGIGKTLLSTFSGHPADSGPKATAGLMRLDTHIDIIDWRATRGFVGEPSVLERLVDCLVLERVGGRLGQPIGVLTHHKVHDDECWAFLDRLLTFVGKDERIECVFPTESAR